MPERATKLPVVVAADEGKSALLLSPWGMTINPWRRSFSNGTGRFRELVMTSICPEF